MRDVPVDAEIIKAAAQLACRAPSVHNSQPWRWVLDGDALHLFIDPDHVAPSTDSSGREALISCGAVLDHLRVAMAASGWTAHVDRFPNPNDLDHLASVDFSANTFVTDGHRRRAEAILARRTDRLPFAEPPDWKLFESELRATLDTAAVPVAVIAEEHRPQLAQASDLVESLRLYDSSYHKEIHWWTSGAPRNEGIPQSALVSAAEGDRVDVGRSFPVTHDSHRRAEVSEDRSKIVVLSTFDDTRDSVLRCGEALSALLLDATMAGLATCTVTHLMELPATREIVAKLSGSNTPQVLVRVGLAPAAADVPAPTPRRPIDEVFEVRRVAPQN
ncbi:NAD(P)H nitroreductase [Mycolicibacterium hippocampi]|uniref:Acg family FMN-binding oxidoreductase n=1 Tax=Mycolicibacterium hippocampi TaxID=659824 RepID=UPI003512C511